MNSTMEPQGLAEGSTLLRPRVSVLMCVHDEPATMVRRAVASILEQTFTDFEFVIVDDGTTKVDTVKALADARRDSRVRVESGVRRGFPGSLNHGLSLTKGELICRQDPDDWSDSCRFEKQVRYLELHPQVMLLGTNVRLHQENGRPLWTTSLPQTASQIRALIPHLNPFAHGSVCFRRRVLATVGNYSEHLDRVEDYDFFWRICEQYEACNLPEALYSYRFRRHAHSISASVGRSQALDLLRRAVAERSAARRLQGSSSRCADRPTNEIDSQLARADHLLLAGAYREAAALYSAALKQAWSRGRPWLKAFRALAFLMLPPVRQMMFEGSVHDRLTVALGRRVRLAAGAQR